jgi:hypothetical protein
MAVLAEADRLLAHLPDIGLKEPHLLEHVTPEFVQQEIGSRIPGAKLLEMVKTDAHAGMTDRGKWDLTWNSAGVDGRLPSAIFVKATPYPPQHREMMAVLHHDHVEASFYTFVQPELPEITPACYYARAYPGGRSLIVTEDLTKRGCKPHWQGDFLSPEHARAIAATQAIYHAKFWGSERFSGDLSWLRPRLRKFGWPWQIAAHREVCEKLMENPTEQELAPDMAPLLRSFNANRDLVYRYQDGLPATMLHGDSHLGNTFEIPDGRSGYYDWQCMIAGHGLRDLSYFLMSGFTDEQRREHERGIFDFYIDALADKGVKLDRDTAWHDYCLFVFDRWDAAIMGYVHASYNHSREGQLRQFRTVAGAIRDNDVVARYEHLLRKMRD